MRIFVIISLIYFIYYIYVYKKRRKKDLSRSTHYRGVLFSKSGVLSLLRSSICYSGSRDPHVLICEEVSYDYRLEEVHSKSSFNNSPQFLYTRGAYQLVYSCKENSLFSHIHEQFTMLMFHDVDVPRGGWFTHFASKQILALPCRPIICFDLEMLFLEECLPSLRSVRPSLWSMWPFLWSALPRSSPSWLSLLFLSEELAPGASQRKVYLYSSLWDYGPHVLHGDKSIFYIVLLSTWDCVDLICKPPRACLHFQRTFEVLFEPVPLKEARDIFFLSKAWYLSGGTQRWSLESGLEAWATDYFSWLLQNWNMNSLP